MSVKKADKPVKEKNFTPMMQQYLDVKNENKDSILMYRLGDFYEMFFDDARTASRELDLTLTGRDCGQEERAPMCGVPYHSAEGYIARLVAKGYKVAICEQMEDPAQAKGLVRREIIRKITPGTVLESSMLEEGKNNFIGAVYLDTRGAGVCFCDISTGEVFGTQLSGSEVEQELESELGRFSPRELLLSDGAYSREGLLAFAKDRLNAYVERAGEWRYQLENAREAAARQFPGQQLPEDQELLLRAVGGLLSYLHETQKNDLAYISNLQVYSLGQFMELDYTARRNLELTASLHGGEKKGSLLWVLDKTRTAMGARLLRQWIEKPLLSVSRITRRQNAVETLVRDFMLRERLEKLLSGVNDMERIASRVVYGSANGRDLRSLYQVCSRLPDIRACLAETQDPLLQTLYQRLDPLEDIGALIGDAIVDEPPFSVREGGLIRPGFHQEADRLRDLLNGGSARLADIERKERERTGISKLKVGYNKVFGYYIECGRVHEASIPDDYIRKQTLANCERYITPELKALEGEVLSASDRLTALEYQLFTQVRERIAAQVARLQQSSQAVACVDVLCSLARVAQQNHYVKPRMDELDVIDIRDGRHPVVEQVLEGELFVPNDTLLDCGDNRVYIITGPNMAGKSTFMRQVALIVIMAQIGSFVPASSATIGICDRVFTRIGASDDLFAGRSTFMVEMNEVGDILKYATRRSLLILDEIGRGTSTFDGMSIARAVLEYVADRKKLGARTLFATHYHELCELEGLVEGVKNYNIVVKKRGDDIIFIKKIVPGGANDSYGIEVAKLAGLPEAVIRRAKAVLAEIEIRQPGVLPSLAPQPEPEEDDGQITLGAFAEKAVMDQLRQLEPDTLSPIEALGLLYQLTKQAKEC